MAEKRMFTQKIIDSDAFLDMPLSTQALYFHLNMRADDDGFVNNPRKLQRYIGAGDDDLKLLLAKRFLIGFESGVIVIKHWRMHNTLRRDRYSPTQYQEELAMLDVKGNRAYTERDEDGVQTGFSPGLPNGCQVVAKRLPNGCHSVGEEREVEEREGEGSVEEGRGAGGSSSVPDESVETVDKPTLQDVSEYIKQNGLCVNPARFFTYYNEREWRTVSGNVIDWRMKLGEWDFDDRQKVRENAAASAPAASGNPFLDMAREEGIT